MIDMADYQMPEPTPMGEHYIRPEHLAAMTQIARVSGKAPGKALWTELAVYYRTGFNRPFVAVVEGLVDDGMRTDLIPRFKSLAAGTLDRAVAWFEGSELRDHLVQAIPDDAVDTYPDGNAMAAKRASSRATLRVVGITTASLREALEWLYPNVTSAAALAQGMETDFCIPARTVRNAMAIEAGGGLGNNGPWVALFLKTMQCFDRELWLAGQATIASVEG